MINTRRIEGRQWAKVAVGAVALALLLLFGPFRKSDVVATVAGTNGSVARDYRGHEEQWAGAVLGAELRVGDAVKTEVQATAVLSLRDGAALSMEPETIVRFTAERPGAPDFRVEAGEAGVQTSASSIRIETAFGLLSLEGQSTLRIQQQEDTTQLRVDMGRASFIDPQSEPQTILPGDELIIDARGKTELRKKNSPARPGDKQGPGQPLLAATRPLDGDLKGRTSPGESVRPSLPAPPTRADLSLHAGESATVHDVSSDTSVRIRFTRVCDEGEGQVELASATGKFTLQAMAKKAALLRVSPGVNRYRVRCVEQNQGTAKVVATGQIRVIRDAAVRRVPLKPPTNMIDLDGRRYTVLYQNKLPSVVLKAPGGKPAARLVVRSGSRMRTFELQNRAYTMGSGELADGGHEVFFESADGKVRSPVTTVRITFDNAAPLASIDQQGLLARDGAGNVHLSGVVPLGSRVSLSEQPLTVDLSGRFAASASPKADDSAVALRVEHPRAGLHYYVRHFDGASDP